MTLRTSGLVVASLVIAAVSVRAQIPIPSQRPGVIGTIGLDGTVDKFYSVTHRAIVKTADGVRHLVHVDKRTVIHGATSTADDSLGELEEGSHVVVHYVEDGDRKTALEIDRLDDGAFSLVEGTVLHVDRAAKTLAIHLADDSTVTLRLTDRAAQHVGEDVESADRVIVYYADEGGERVAHYFRKAS
jgi:hypothetical protein